MLLLYSLQGRYIMVLVLQQNKTQNIYIKINATTLTTITCRLLADHVLWCISVEWENVAYTKKIKE